MPHDDARWDVPDFGGLLGRAVELSLIRGFLGRSAGRGEALVLSGEAGMGKSVLLDAAATIAENSGSVVLRASGVQFEADLPFAGLGQLLQPLRAELRLLEPGARDALQVALGLTEAGPTAGRRVISATRALLARVAADRPLLVIVDDVHWLDRASAAALGAVARDLPGAPLGLLAARRVETAGFFDSSGLPERELGPLDDDAAAAVVRSRFPGIDRSVLRRLLAAAEGNPLALLELPTALSGPHRDASEPLPLLLPRTRRLQSVFAGHVRDLPPATRRVLLLAALDSTGDLDVLRGASPGDTGLDDLDPARRARLVYVDERSGRVEFRHPLIRAAVVDLSTGAERRLSHRRLADGVADRPERRAWHLADATLGPDEQVAALLEQTAHRVLRRGDADGAVQALIRAADLSEGPHRSRRLAEAARLGVIVTGDVSSVPELLVQGRLAGPSAADSLRMAAAGAYLQLNGDGHLETAHRLLVGAIETHGPRYRADDDALMEALGALMLVCMFGGRPELWEPFHTTLTRIRPGVPGDLALAAATYADPARTAFAARDHLVAAIALLDDEPDPWRILKVASAAQYVLRLDGCRAALWRVMHTGRAGGPAGQYPNAVNLLCADQISTGHWSEADALVAEGLALCATSGLRLLEWTSYRSRAHLAALRGDHDGCRSAVETMLRWGIPRGVGQVTLSAHHARMLIALGDGDADEAYLHAVAISPPGTFAPQLALATWICMDLVEAAVRSGRRAEAQAHVDAIGHARLGEVSPHFALLAAGSAALVADGDRASSLFEAASALPGAEDRPFELARIQLAHGEHLRRSRATAASRIPLTAAHEAFQRLGAAGWTARAGAELRAAGGSAARAGRAPAALTPQEHEIAVLAAAGLTNNQIAQRLGLSRRTVEAHLHRVFAKLAVTSRAALGTALLGTALLDGPG